MPLRDHESRPRLLDLFCCAGGAAKGYYNAGFEVVGVDIEPQPNYPYEFIQADALWVLTTDLQRYDAIHASPPCQMFTAYRRSRPDKGDENYVNLIPATRELLQDSGLPYVIENVEGSPLREPVRLCGSMFDPPLDVQRHRLFETNWGLEPPPWPCRHKVWGPDRFPGGRSKERTGSNKGLARGTVEIGTWDIPLERQAEAMEVDWMNVKELSQAIPPRYTEFIGRQLLAHVQQAVAA